MKLPKPFNENLLINVVVETPKGSRNKFVYEEKGAYFKLKKVLPEGTSFPVDVGFIPHTRSGDGERLDVFLYMESLTYPGCVVECRAIGVIEVEQQEGDKKYRNDRVVSADHDAITDIKDISVNTLNELLNFCRYYNEFEGKKFNVLNIKGNKDAMKAIKESAIN